MLRARHAEMQPTITHARAYTQIRCQTPATLLSVRVGVRVRVLATMPTGGSSSTR